MSERIGVIAKHLRKRLGLDLCETSRLLGVATGHLIDMERGTCQIPGEIIDRYREAFGVDLYCYAAVHCRAHEDMPYPAMASAKTLCEAWEEEIESAILEFIGRRK